MVFANNEFIPRKFSMRNRDYLMKYVDSNLKLYCKVMFKGDVSKFRIGMVLLTSLLFLYLLCKYNVLFIDLKSYKFWIIVFLVFTNVNFVISSYISKVIHKTHIRNNIKVVKVRTLKNRFGYYFAYVGFDSEGRIIVYSIDRLKKKKRIKLDNPRLFLVTDECVEAIIIEYLYSNEVKDLNWLKNEIFLYVKAEYFREVARQQAIDEMIEAKEIEREFFHV